MYTTSGPRNTWRIQRNSAALDRASRRQALDSPVSVLYEGVGRVTVSGRDPWCEPEYVSIVNFLLRDGSKYPLASLMPYVHLSGHGAYVSS